MANLPNNSFVDVNDVETAQGAPVSEALAQKFGTNENTNNNEIVLNDADIATNAADIATNVTDIATNTSAIAALVQPETFNASLNPTGAFATLNTFSATPTLVLVSTVDAANIAAVILFPGDTVIAGILEYRLTGALLEVRENTGTVGLTSFNMVGWV